MPENKELIKDTIEFVKNELHNAEGGHDWWHIYRVWKMATRIAEEENANQTIVQIASLLHDIADSKFHEGDEEIGSRKATEFLKTKDVDQSIIDHVSSIISNMSFKNTFDNITFNSLELDIVRDADRLDAIGAVGIARTFNYGGHTGAEIYNPNISPRKKLTKADYKSTVTPTINHFYEKLLTLSSRMNTSTGKKLAIERHKFMETYLNQFYAEWVGRK